VRRHILGEVVDLIPYFFLPFIQEYDGEKNIEIDPHLWELWGIICVPQIFLDTVYIYMDTEIDTTVMHGSRQFEHTFTFYVS